MASQLLGSDDTGLSFRGPDDDGGITVAYFVQSHQEGTLRVSLFSGAGGRVTHNLDFSAVEHLQEYLNRWMIENWPQDE